MAAFSVAHREVGDDPEHWQPPRPCYHLTVLPKLGSLMDLRAMNEQGDLVGTFADMGRHPAAFLYTREHGLVDLNSMLPDDCPWRLFSANAINNQQTIVGSGRLPGDTMSRPYRLEFTADGSVTVSAIGEFQPSDSAIACGINDFGEVCGICRPLGNDQFVWMSTESGLIQRLALHGLGTPSPPVGITHMGQIVGALTAESNHIYRIAPGHLSEVFETTQAKLTLHDLNDAGEFVGAVNLPGRDAAFRSNGYDFQEIDERSQTVFGINNCGDMVGCWKADVLELGTKHFGFVYLEALQKPLDLDELITGPPEALRQWFAPGTRPQPRQINDAGMIAGVLGDSAQHSRVFLLTPVGPPAPMSASQIVRSQYTETHIERHTTRR